jgi:Doubled CXXCH motif (Paired_CXXCH_1)
VGCHTAAGFTGKIAGSTTVDTTYNAITCQTCHEPHGETIPTTNAHLVRALSPVTLADGTAVTTAGMGTLCINCHQSRQNAATYVETTAGSAHFGPHSGPQADMLMGTNAVTYGKKIPSSAHADMVTDTCVTCHMQTPAATDKALGQVGGHTFKMKFAGTAAIPTSEMVTACQGCHGPDLTTIDFQLMDYDNDGTIDGVQTEVQHLLDKLSVMLPPVGQPKSALTIDSSWTKPQLKAAYNWLFVKNDGSLGIHNTAYAVGLLDASIKDLSAPANK